MPSAAVQRAPAQIVASAEASATVSPAALTDQRVCTAEESRLSNRSTSPPSPPAPGGGWVGCVRIPPPVVEEPPPQAARVRAAAARAAMVRNFME